jgi:cell wall-associated NlpC family hydrolase
MDVQAGLPRAPRPRRRALTRAAGAVLAAGALVAGMVLIPGGMASAETDLTRARAQAAALRADLAELDARAEAAAEDYGDVNAQLDGLVTRMISADSELDEATREQREGIGRQDDVVREMYMSGGPTALYASVLAGRDIGDVLDRIASVESVVRGDIVATAVAGERAEQAAQDRADMALLVAQRRVLEDKRKSIVDRVVAIRRQAAAKLADADALVRRLVEEERAAAERAAEAAAWAQAQGQAPWTRASVPADSYQAVDAAIAAASAAPATAYAVGALTDARQWLGTPYSAGGGGPSGPSTGWCSSSAPDDGRTDSGDCLAERTVGFDCSSFVQRIYSAAGLALPRTSRQQWFAGRHVRLADLQPGDLLFWAYSTGNPSSIHHVAMYLGDGLMVHSPHTGDHVRVATVYLNGYIGAVRPG